MEQASRIQYETVNARHPDEPLVDVLIVNSRGVENAWFKQAVYSVRQQTYGNVGLLVVYNNDHSLSIGAAWNLGVKASAAKYVLMVGDDDTISIDLVAHLATTIETLRRRKDCENLKMVTSWCTMIDQNDQPLVRSERGPNKVLQQLVVQLHHTGMFLREYVAENPFNEDLVKHVSTDMQNRISRLGELGGFRTVWATSYHYGYMYRQHIGMVSGEKVLRKA